MSLLIIVDRVEKFRWARPGDRIVAADEYFRDDPEFCRPDTKVINLCKGQDYLGAAHFCSVIAEARQQSVVPGAETLLQLAQRKLWTEQLRSVNQALLPENGLPEQGTRTFTLFFGEASDPDLHAIGRRIHAAFPFPILHIAISFEPDPVVTQLIPLTLEDITTEDEARFRTALDRLFGGDAERARKPADGRLRLAILHNPNEALAPSRMPTLRKFVQIGADMDIAVELILHRDLGRLGEFDALFIRETTAINRNTYRFAEKAERLGIPVIDDPVSIRRCTNKVYLAELLRTNGVPHPKTWIVRRETLANLETMPFPVVLKKPDGAFSIGVERAATPYEFRSIASEMMAHSDLIVAQEFVASDFDWRIGVLAGRPLYAARYFMCPRHWQVLKHAHGDHTEGKTQAVSISEVPSDVVRQAVRAAGLIGDGLYGVDIKETSRGPLVIEINDNPNLETGLEDRVIGDRLYSEILEHLRLLASRSLAERHRRIDSPPLHRERRYRLAASAAA